MPEYIEREAALKIIDNYGKTVTADAVVVVEAIKDIVGVITPAADVVEVVRCKDCEYWRKFDSSKVGICRESHIQQKRKANDFCSYGERKVDVDDG